MTEASRRWLQGGLLLGLGAQGLWLAWVLLAPVPAAPLPAPPRAVATLDPALAALAFGGGGTAAPADASGLALVGVRLASEPGASTAVIAAEGGQRVVGLGEPVRQGLRLAAVAPGHVVLEGDGREIRLSLPGARDELPSAPAPAPLPASNPASDVDPRQLLAEAGLRPRLRGGRLDGFTVIARGDGRALASAGLQSGDVLLAVNGESLTPERMTELGQLLQAGQAGGGTTTLTVERGDTRHTLTFPPESP